MNDAIAITVLSTSFPPTFRVASAGGSEAQVTQFIVSDAASRMPMWWVVSQPWADAVDFHPMWVDFTPDAEEQNTEPEDYSVDPVEDLPSTDPRHQAALRGPIDPLEDLAPSDPRHQEALRRLRIDQVALRQPLAVVTYGVVPAGFREVYPGDGAPQVLSASSSYVVFADGLVNEGTIAFSLA